MTSQWLLKSVKIHRWIMEPQLICIIMQFYILLDWHYDVHGKHMYGHMQSHKNPHEEAHGCQQCSNSIITHFICLICCARVPHQYSHTHIISGILMISLPLRF